MMWMPMAEELPFDPNQVTPGVIGFAFSAIIAVITGLLLVDANRRIRRTTFRAEARDRIAEELAERDAQDAEQDDARIDGDAQDDAAAATESPMEPQQDRSEQR